MESNKYQPMNYPGSNCNVQYSENGMSNYRGSDYNAQYPANGMSNYRGSDYNAQYPAIGMSNYRGSDYNAQYPSNGLSNYPGSNCNVQYSANGLSNYPLSNYSVQYHANGLSNYPSSNYNVQYHANGLSNYASSNYNVQYHANGLSNYPSSNYNVQYSANELASFYQNESKQMDDNIVSKLNKQMSPQPPVTSTAVSDNYGFYRNSRYVTPQSQYGSSETSINITNPFDEPTVTSQAVIHPNQDTQSDIHSSPSYSKSQLSAILDNADEYTIDSFSQWLSQNNGPRLSNVYSPLSTVSHHADRDIRINGKFIEMGSIQLSEEELTPIYRNDRFCNGYNNFFISKLNKIDDLSCVLISNGPYRAPKSIFWTLRYYCKHHECKRFYKVFQMTATLFKVYRNLVDIVHDSENPMCRPMNGEKRIMGINKLKNQLPDKYLDECESKADKNLVLNGNLQDIISLGTAKLMRHEALAENDFDKDEIVDLLIMMLSESENEKKKVANKDPEKKFGNESISYIQRICLEPFIVTLFTDDQFSCLKLLSKDDTDVTVFFDATGGILNYAGKVIYYYAGVTRDFSIPLKLNERRRLLPLFECISAAHAIFNIGLVLREYKHQFHIKFPTLKWPIRKAVTDMSYAIMNAICHSWNNMKLIDYINLTYEVVNQSLAWSTLTEHHNIETFIRICSGHLSKNFSLTLEEYYPNMAPEQQKIIKEIFAGMFSIHDLQKLRTIWLHFSTVLLSRYTDENVKISLNKLATIITDTDKNESNIDPESDGESDSDYQFNGWKLPESDEHQSMYQSSRFYQDFKNVTFDKEFEDMFEVPRNVERIVNPYHSPKFCELFLQKYISILSLWTCSSRIANSPAESHFKNTKKDAISQAAEIGRLPLKCGRFIRFLKQRVCRVTQSITLGAPRYRNTKNKRKDLCSDDVLPPKKRKLHVNSNVSNVYKLVKPNSNKKRSDTTSTQPVENGKEQPLCPAQIESNVPEAENEQPLSAIGNANVQPRSSKGNKTSLSNIPPAIDDPHVIESWGRKPKRKFTYFNAESLSKLRNDKKELENVLVNSKQPVKCSKTKILNNMALKNDLVDHPNTYLAPENDFVVASTGTLNLNQQLYKQLLPDVKLSNHLIAYILAVFAKKYKGKSVQFEIYKTETIIKASDRPILKITKDILIAVHLNESIDHFSLIIVNTIDCTFSVIDPLTQSASHDEYFLNFLNFVDKFNKSSNARQLPTRDMWTYRAYSHQTQTDNVNCGIFVLQYIKQYLKTGKMNELFQPSEYRIELQHLILRKSIKMTGRCVVCGYGKLIDKITNWVKCDHCSRWTHMHCTQTDENSLFDDSIHYFCLICTSNTSRADLRNMSEDVQHFKSFSQTTGNETIDESIDDSFNINVDIDDL